LLELKHYEDKDTAIIYTFVHSVTDTPQFLGVSSRKTIAIKLTMKL
jgi:hypothetical protein